MPHRFVFSEEWSRELTAAAPKLARCRDGSIVGKNDKISAAGSYKVGETEHPLPPLPETTRVTVPATTVVVAEQPFSETIVAVALADTLSAALMVEGSIALNFANAYNPGGGYRHGAQAQEEDLCRLVPQLITTLEATKYPIEENECLVTIGLPAVREVGTYELCPSKGLVNFLTAAMPCGPSHTDSQEYFDDVKMRIRSVLHAARVSGYANLILGAWGCGAFGNPPDTVAALFREVICSEEYRGSFSKIVFAIVDPRGDGNFESFRREVSKVGEMAA